MLPMVMSAPGVGRSSEQAVRGLKKKKNYIWKKNASKSCKRKKNEKT